ncbi:TetR family transcriptional regulator [Niabella ginsenosidivorans]|uniref:TetR family transcriptional regulator n=1 Tax=Niabella ginsenosidivorans TaxID=1176587 RepID=A0A1A9I0U2_9BACT|nr:TetR/AcrR family transcriptional regulator [Niabella ginsenosidivorans]ANH81133.1 TetR family transcriptional regulator [Niabella ginsenosidivorans]
MKEKRSKYKMDLRRAIQDAAKELFLKEGFEATSIRKIAAKIGFSPTTIYLYYKDKAEIAYELHSEGFRLLNLKFEVLRLIRDPFERLKLMGRIYIQFSLDKPDFYELMFVLKEPILHLVNDNEIEHWGEGQAAMDGLKQNIKECQEAGYFSKMDTATTALVVWSTVHGLCSLKLHGHLDHVCSEEEGLQQLENPMEAIYETFIQMLEQIK